MSCNYAQGSYSAQYDDNCIRGFYRALLALAGKLLLSPFLSHSLACLSSRLPSRGASFTPIRSGPQPNEHF